MKATIEAMAFNRLIGAVKAFASRTNSRPALTMIQLHFSAQDKKATAYATDGYRAAKECALCYTVDEDFSVLVSAPPLKAKSNSIVEVELDGDVAYISFGEVRFRNKQPTNEPFDVEKFISDVVVRKNVNVLGVNADYLIDALKSLKASGATARHPVIIEFGGPHEPIVLRTDSDNQKVVLPVRIKAVSEVAEE